jgi:hypothetical protein
MTQTGGKRKVNKSLKNWVAFIKKVQREENLSYKDAMMRAKQRKDKGEKWMKGGNVEEVADEMPMVMAEGQGEMMGQEEMMGQGEMMGGRKHRRRTSKRRTHRARSHKRRRTARRRRH